MEIRPVPPSTLGPQGLEALAATAAPAPEATPAPQHAVSNALDPPVKVEIGTSAHAARFVRDVDTRALVLQVVDPGSGDVIVQLPTETVLRNRAYVDSERIRATQAGRISRVA